MVLLSVVTRLVCPFCLVDTVSFDFNHVSLFSWVACCQCSAGLKIVFSFRAFAPAALDSLVVLLSVVTRLVCPFCLVDTVPFDFNHALVALLGGNVVSARLA